jgi:hypothetical protein
MSDSIDFDEIGNDVQRFTVPIYTDVRASPVQVACGLLLAIGNRSFLVSAAHVFERQERQFFLVGHLADDRARIYWLPADSDLIGLAEGTTRDDDDLDVGYVELLGELPPYPQVNLECLPLHRVAAWRPVRNKYYGIFGYPSSKMRVNPLVKEFRKVPVYGYLNPGAEYLRYAANKIDPRQNLLIPFDAKKKQVFKDGRQETFPDPAGMSGSPVWEFRFSGSGEAKRKVVGIYTGNSRTSMEAQATDIGVVLQLMRQQGIKPDNELLRITDRLSISQIRVAMLHQPPW